MLKKFRLSLGDKRKDRSTAACFDFSCWRRVESWSNNFWCFSFAIGEFNFVMEECKGLWKKFNGFKNSKNSLHFKLKNSLDSKIQEFLGFKIKNSLDFKFEIPRIQKFRKICKFCNLAKKFKLKEKRIWIYFWMKWSQRNVRRWAGGGTVFFDDRLRKFAVQLHFGHRFHNFFHFFQRRIVRWCRGSFFPRANRLKQWILKSVICKFFLHKLSFHLMLGNLVKRWKVFKGESQKKTKSRGELQRFGAVYFCDFVKMRLPHLKSPCFSNLEQKLSFQLLLLEKGLKSD